MTLRAALACALLLAAGCGKRQPDDAAAITPAKPASQAPDAPERTGSQTGSDAGVSVAEPRRIDAAPESSTPSALELRLTGYAKLLAIDVSLFQLIESYPGAPKGTTFETGDYQWRRHEWLALDEMQKEIDAILTSSTATPSVAADTAVQAYAQKVAGWIPRLISLAAYHDGRKFIDDEFDRGRAEAGDLRRTATEIAKLRAPMRSAVFAAWRDLVADYRDSPRAIVAHAWLACMSIADRVMEQAKPEAIAKAVSECRRSIPKITGIPSTAGFDTTVRSAASELGDWVAQGYPSWRTYVGDALGRLTLRYVELWPKLPTTPAEKPMR